MINKYRRRKGADNYFTAKTGTPALYVQGGSNCLVTQHSTYNYIPIQRYCYCLSIDSNPKHRFPAHARNSAIKVSTSCGVLNCIKPEHFLAYYKPSKKDIEYIKDYIKIDGINSMAHRLDIPAFLLRSYIDKNTI